MRCGLDLFGEMDVPDMEDEYDPEPEWEDDD
jgi:hypothetical protein